MEMTDKMRNCGQSFMCPFGNQGPVRLTHLDRLSLNMFLTHFCFRQLSPMAKGLESHVLPFLTTTGGFVQNSGLHWHMWFKRAMNLGGRAPARDGYTDQNRPVLGPSGLVRSVQEQDKTVRRFLVVTEKRSIDNCNEMITRSNMWLS